MDGGTAGETGSEDASSDGASGVPADAGNETSTDGDAAPDAGASHVLTALEIDPVDAVVAVGLGAPSSTSFTAVGHYSDGSSVDLSASVAWTVSNPEAGAITGPTLQIPAYAGPQAIPATITATLGDVTGSTRVTIVAHGGAAGEGFVVLPYQGGTKTLSMTVTTAIPALDVFFLTDATGSMGGEITSLANGLTSTIVPAVRDAVHDSRFGVGAFEDFPLSPYGNVTCAAGGNGADQPFKLRQAITADDAAVLTGLDSLKNGAVPIGCGGDGPEAAIEGLFQVATGQGLTAPSPTNVPANHTGIGGVGFRYGTLPVVVTITDAPSHGANEVGTCGTDALAYGAPPVTSAHSRTEARDVLRAICARSIGVAAIGTQDASCQPLSFLSYFATETGARVPPSAWGSTLRPAGCTATQCCTGMNGTGVAPDANGQCPLVFRIATSGAGLAANIASGVQLLTQYGKYEGIPSTSGEPNDVGSAPLPATHDAGDFVQSIATKGATVPAANVALPISDGLVFHGVTPGTKLSFDALLSNTFLPQTNTPRLFKISFSVGDGCFPLAEKDMWVLVPALPL